MSSVSGGDGGLEVNSSFNARSGTVSHTCLSETGSKGFVGTSVGFGACVGFGGYGSGMIWGRGIGSDTFVGLDDAGFGETVGTADGGLDGTGCTTGGGFGVDFS